MAKIEAGTLQYFLIDGVPKQRGEYEIVSDIIGATELVGIRMVGRDGWVQGCELQNVTNYTDNTDTPIPTLNDFFVYVSAFMFGANGGGGGGGSVDWSAITNKPTTFTPSPHTHPSDQISDSTAAGRALLIAADVVEQRTILGIQDPNTLQWDSVRVATTGDITLSGLQTIDGVTLVATDRVLVWQQANPVFNGIYTAEVGAWIRATDADNTAEFEAGKEVNVLEGNTHASAIFINNTPDPVSVGIDAITFTKSSAEFPRVSQSNVLLARYSAGAGRVEETLISPKFTVSGGTFDVANGVFIEQNGNSFGAAVSIGTNDAFDVNIRTNNSNRVAYKNDGRVWFGAVDGTTPTTRQYVFKALNNSTSEATVVLQRNSDNQDLIVMRNDGVLQFGAVSTGRAGIRPTSGSVSSTGIEVQGANNAEAFRVAGGQFGIATSGDVFLVTTGTYARSSGEHNIQRISNTINPTSGNSIDNLLTINPTVNQTGTASGEVRLINLAPTTTSVLGRITPVRINTGATANATHIKLQNSTTGSDITDGTNIELSGSNVVINNLETASIVLRTSNTDRITVDGSGLVGIGTAPVVNTRMVVNGVGNTTNTILALRRLDGSNVFRFFENSTISFGNFTLQCYSNNAFSGELGGTNFSAYATGTSNSSSTGRWYFFTNGNSTQTSGANPYFVIRDNFAPTSGTATHATLQIDTQVNQTGGANGTTWGVRIAPTLTSAADWRSFEFTNNIGRGIWGSGTAPSALAGTLRIGTASNAQTNAQLQVDSTARGFLPPRLTTAQRDAVTWTAADEGMMIFNTTTKKHQGYDGTTWNDLY